MSQAPGKQAHCDGGDKRKRGDGFPGQIVGREHRRLVKEDRAQRHGPGGCAAAKDDKGDNGEDVPGIVGRQDEERSHQQHANMRKNILRRLVRTG